MVSYFASGGTVNTRTCCGKQWGGAFTRGAAPEEKGVKSWSVRDLFCLFPFGFDLAVVFQLVLRVRGLHPASRDAPWRASFSQRLVLLCVQERVVGPIRHSRDALGRRFRGQEVPCGLRRRRMCGAFVPSQGAWFVQPGTPLLRNASRFPSRFTLCFQVSKMGLITPFGG